MQEIEKDMEYELLSVYKKTIWNCATQIRFNNITMHINEMMASFEKEVYFYMLYVYDNG